jgi:hypothetical protein
MQTFNIILRKLLRIVGWQKMQLDAHHRIAIVALEDAIAITMNAEGIIDGKVKIYRSVFADREVHAEATVVIATAIVTAIEGSRHHIYLSCIWVSF